ncbi:MAG: LTA synthase family protein [Bacteroidota bacterium]
MRFLSLSRDAALRVGLLVGPLAVFVGSLRLAGWQGTRSLDGAGALTIAASDAGVLVCFGIAAAVGLSLLGGTWAQRIARGVLYGLVALIGVGAVFQYGYSYSFGFPLERAIFATHATSSDAHSLVGVVASEFSPGRTALLVFPFALIASIVLFLRSSRVRQWAARGPDASPRAAVLLGVVALGLAVPVSANGEYARLVRPLPEAPWGLIPDEVTPAFEARESRAVATDSTRRHNVVLVILESVRARSTGPWGGPVPTPTLDSLAARGLVVDEMLAMTPYTNKTIGAMLSGILPSPETKLRANVPGGLPAVGLPDLLRPHGYRSLFVTPALLRFERKDVILENLGFDDMLGAETLLERGARQLDPRAFGVDDLDPIAPTLDWAEARVREGTPFLLTMLTLTGHYPYAIPPGSPRLGLSEDEDESAYLDAIAHTDRALGALVDGLERMGAMDSTMVLIVGDHGQSFGEHGYFAHGDGLYHEALHVPGIVVAPGVEPGRVRGPRQLTDLVPTVLDGLGLRLEDARLPGRSLLSPPDPDRWLFFGSHHEHVATAARWDRWKAICRWTCDDMEIYDLARDLAEAEDLADAWPQARRDSIGAAMARWRASVRASYL